MTGIVESGTAAAEPLVFEPSASRRAARRIFGAVLGGAGVLVGGILLLVGVLLLPAFLEAAKTVAPTAIRRERAYQQETNE